MPIKIKYNIKGVPYISNCNEGIDKIDTVGGIFRALAKNIDFFGHETPVIIYFCKHFKHLKDEMKFSELEPSHGDLYRIIKLFVYISEKYGKYYIDLLGHIIRAFFNRSYINIYSSSTEAGSIKYIVHKDVNNVKDIDFLESDIYDLVECLVFEDINNLLSETNSNKSNIVLL